MKSKNSHFAEALTLYFVLIFVCYVGRISEDSFDPRVFDPSTDYFWSCVGSGFLLGNISFLCIMLWAKPFD